MSDETPTPTNRAERVRSRRQALVLLFALVLFALVYRVGLDHEGRHRNIDEGLWTSAVAFMSESGLSLVDVLAPAGGRPLHLAVYAAADRVAGHYSIRVVGAFHAVFVGLTAFFLAALGVRRLGLRRLQPLFLGMAYVVFSYSLYEGENSNSEHLVVFFLAGFALAWFEAERRGSRVGRWLAFVLMGCAFYTKKQIFPCVLAAPWLWWLCLRQVEPGWRGFVREALGSAAGFLAPVAALAALGGVDYGNAVSHALALDHMTAARLLKFFNRGYQHLSAVPVMLFACLVALAALSARVWVGDRVDSEPELRFLRPFSALFVLALLSTTPGMRLYSHYFLIPLAPAVLVSAGGLVWLARHGKAPTSFLCAIAGLWLLICAPAHYLSFQRRPLASDVEMAGWIQRNTAPDERIFVWGSAPQLYLYSERVPASRFTACWGLVNDVDVPGLPAFQPQLLELLLEDLNTHRPSLVVIPRDMNFAFDRDRYLLARVPPFASWLESNYGPPLLVSGHVVLRPKR